MASVVVVVAALALRDVVVMVVASAVVVAAVAAVTWHLSRSLSLFPKRPRFRVVQLLVLLVVWAMLVLFKWLL